MPNPLNVGVVGSFDSLIDFIDSVQEIRRSVSIKSYTCSRSERGVEARLIIHDF